MKVDIAQNFLPDSITKPDILKSNKSMTRNHYPTLLFALASFYDKARVM